LCYNADQNSSQFHLLKVTYRCYLFYIYLERQICKASLDCNSALLRLDDEQFIHLGSISHMPKTKRRCYEPDDL